MLIQYTNDATALLAAPIAAGDTTLFVEAGTGAAFPAPVSAQSGFYVTVVLNDTKERMFCTARSGDTLTVTRGVGGTTPSAFAAAAEVSLRLNAELLDSKLGVLHTDALDLYVATTGDDTTGAGTLAAPYLTVARALQEVRNYTSLTSTVTIHIAAGVYTQVEVDASTHLGSRLHITGANNSFTDGTQLTVAGTVRADSTVYAAGVFVIPATPTGYWYECTTGGTTAASPPTFGTVEGGTTVDGTVVWTCRAYHDVTATFTGLYGATPLAVGRYVTTWGWGNTLVGTHKVISASGSDVVFRVYDRAARVVETPAAMPTMYTASTVLTNAVGASVWGLPPNGAMSPQFYYLVFDGQDRDLGAYGIEAGKGEFVEASTCSVVNCDYATSPAGGVLLGCASNCYAGAYANGPDGTVSITHVSGCDTGLDGAAMARVGAGSIQNCAIGVDLSTRGMFRYTSGVIRNCGTGISARSGSAAFVGTIKDCNLGISVLGGVYAEVTTFTTNTTNSDLTVNTVGNANSYVKN